MNNFVYADKSRWIMQLTLLASLLAVLTINPVKAVELKPISAHAASAPSSTASVSATWESDDSEASQPAEDAEKKARQDEQMGQEIAKEVVHNVMSQLPQNEHSNFFNGSTVSLALLIPILAITFVIGGPIFIVIYLIRARYQSKQRRLESINANIDKLIAAGRDIPVEMLRGDLPMTNNHTENLHKGIKNVFVGLGLLIFLTLFFNIAFGAIGFIVMAVGLSQLAIWKLSSPRENAEKKSTDNLF